MPTTIPNEERLLPAPEQLELADYLMGSYLSEFEVIASRVKRETETDATISLDEYRRLRDAGALTALDGPDFAERDLFELLRFAADALRDADSIREQAGELQRLVLAVLNERATPSGPDDPAWLAHEERIRVWHAEHVAV